MMSNTLILESLANANNMMFGQRISLYIENAGISKTWLAAKLGISKQALNYLLKHSPKAKFVDELSEVLGLNPEWVEKGVGDPWGCLQKNILPTNEKNSFLTKKEFFKKLHSGRETLESFVKNLIAYKIEDDSSFPPFIEGSILTFDPAKKPKHGDHVLLIIDNDLFVREYIVDGENVCYKANNSEYKTFINPDATLLGVLIEATYHVS